MRVLIQSDCRKKTDAGLSRRVGGRGAVNRNADWIRSISRQVSYMCYMMSALMEKREACCVMTEADGVQH